MGCVYQVGEQSNNVARMSVLASNLPNSCPGTSIGIKLHKVVFTLNNGLTLLDRQCGSSQQAVHFAAQAVMSGSMDAVIACGVESMSRVPMGLSMSLPAKHGFGTYMSPQLQNNYPSEFSQFIGAEMMAKKYGITRNDMDEFSLRSHQRAIAASNTGNFKNEILPLKPIIFNAKTGVTDHVEGKLHTVDEGIRFDATLEGIAKIKPIQENGIITAGNASQICDGASGVLIVSERMLKEFNLTPLARIIHMSLFAGDPVIMLEEPLAGTKAALKKSNLSIHDIDLFEINEAFASVTLSWLKYTDADPEKLNVNGGAIALGHPLGDRKSVV